MDLGIIDNTWEVSMHRELGRIVLIATSLPGASNGWYCARIELEGTIREEKRVLPNGNYAKEPDKHRPNIQAILDMLPEGNSHIVAAIRLAYDILPEEETLEDLGLNSV